MKTVSILFILVFLLVSNLASGQAIRADRGDRGDLPIAARASVPDEHKTQILVSLSPISFHQFQGDPLQIGAPGEPLWVEPGRPVWAGVFLHVAEGDALDGSGVAGIRFDLGYNPSVSQAVLDLFTRKPDDPINVPEAEWATSAYGGQSRPVRTLSSIPGVEPAIWTANPESAALEPRIAFDCPFQHPVTIPPGIWYLCEVAFRAKPADRIILDTGVPAGGTAYSQVSPYAGADFWAPRGTSYPVPDRLGDHVGVRLPAPEAATADRADRETILQQIDTLTYLLGVLRQDVEGL